MRDYSRVRGRVEEEFLGKGVAEGAESSFAGGVGTVSDKRIEGHDGSGKNYVLGLLWSL